ncbi:MAG: M1 family aminopeptidase, partial [Candidatus Kryptonium sp.]
YYTPGDTLIIVKFNFQIPQGQKFRIDIYYRGTVYRTGSSFGGGLDLKQNNIIYADNEPFGLRRWLPSFDLPYEKADTVEARIKVKLGWKTVANGILIDSIIENNWITYYYKTKYPIAPYLIVFASSKDFNIIVQNWNYDNISMPIYHYVKIGNYTPSLYLPYMLAVFTNIFGIIYPFYEEKYGEVEIFEGFFGGAMEDQTNTFTKVTNNEILSAHELAHHWWGNLVTCATFKDIFINEG